MYTRVKICGITRAEDAVSAAEAGADYLGLNFVAGPRKIDGGSAGRILSEMAHHPVVHRIEFVPLCAMSASEYPEASTWQEVLSAQLRTLQIYGRNYASLESAKDLGFGWWMVRHIKERESISNMVGEFFRLDFAPSAIVLDTATADRAGGTGQTFNWEWIAEARAAGELEGLPPIILAGGLTVENVAEAVRIVRPYAVDVSSGVEVAGRPGIKDGVKVRDFIQAAKGA